MELKDRVVAVTGAASGIGRALALRFADERARAVVVSDIDAEGAAAVAAEIDRRHTGTATAIPCDVAEPDAVAGLIERAERECGPIDVFCANAGIGGGPELGTDEEWDKTFAVNVMSHISAARVLVPRWVERGEGYFLSTASAAGLLTMIGSAPYSVTKHAAVGFAEWLSVTYGDAGVRVSCLCPLGVRTRLLDEGLSQPGTAGVGLQIVTSSGTVLEPAEVADAVVAGMAEERFLILPHPEVHQMLQGKVADHDKWLAAMRHVQASVAAAAAAD